MIRFHTGAAIVAALLIPLTFASLPARADQPYKIGSIEIVQPWARATPNGAHTGAAYLVIRNTGKTEDRLIAARSPAATQADVHQMSMKDNVMQMAPVKGGLAIPPGGSVTLQPNGYHIMLIGLKSGLAKGSQIPLTLTFAKAGSIEVQVKVEAIGSMGPASTGISDHVYENMGSVMH